MKTMIKFVKKAVRGYFNGYRKVAEMNLRNNAYARF